MPKAKDGIPSLLALLVFVLTSTSSAHGQPPHFQDDTTVSGAVWTIEALMAGAGPGSLGCKLPIVYQTQDDQLKSKKGAQVDDPQMQQALLQQLQLDAYKTEPATFYDGYVTRLFDTPSSNWIFGALTDQELLGMVQSTTDPNSLLMFNTSSSIVKYDCSSLYKIATQANSKYSLLDILSLQASFAGSQSTGSTKSVVILTGQAQSLFDVYYGSGTPNQKVFATLKAIQWYESPLVKNMTDPATKRLQHLTEARILSFASTENINSSQSIAASISASLNVIPVVPTSATGSASAQLNNAFQQMSSNFKTFYFERNASALPALSDLVSTAQAFVSLTNATTTAAAFPGDVVQLKGDIIGWPPSLCADQMWSGAVKATAAFTFNSSHMQQAAPTAEGLPVCTATLSATVNSGAIAQTTDPGFTVTYKTDSAVSLTLPMPPQLSVSVVTIPTFSTTLVATVPVAVPAALPPIGSVQLLWSVNGSTVTNGQTIQSYTINPSLSCSPSDGSATLLLDSVFATSYGSAPVAPVVFGTSTATSPTIVNPTAYQTIWLGLHADPTIYDTLAPVSAWQSQSCTLNGSLQMTIGGAPVNSQFTLKIPLPPKRAAMSARSVDCSQPIASPKTISLSASTNGAACTLYGTNLDLASQLIISGGTVNLQLPLSLVANSSQAKFTIQATDIAKLTAGTSYAITIGAASGAPPVTTTLTFQVGP